MEDWLNNNTQNKKRVYAVVNGEERPFDIETGKTLKEAVKHVAGIMGFPSVLVKVDDEQIDSTEGDKYLSEVGTVKIYAKYTGA